MRRDLLHPGTHYALASKRTTQPGDASLHEVVVVSADPQDIYTTSTGTAERGVRIHIAHPIALPATYVVSPTRLICTWETHEAYLAQAREAKMMQQTTQGLQRQELDALIDAAFATYSPASRKRFKDSLHITGQGHITGVTLGLLKNLYNNKEN